MKQSLILYFTSEVFLSLGIGIVIYAQPFYYQAAGLSDSTIGTLFAVNSVTAGISALLLGPLADWVGASRMFKLATLLVGLNMLLLGLTRDLSVWYLSAALYGLGASMLLTTENVVLSSLTQGQEKAVVLSRFVSMYSFVMGVGVVAAGFLSAATSYRTAIVTGACFALVAPAIRVFVKAPDARARRLFRLPSKHLTGMAVYALCFGVAFGLFNPFATLILHGTFHLGDRLTSALSASSTFMTALGAFVVGWLLKRLNYDRTLFVSFVFGIGLSLIMAVTGNVLAFAGLYLARTVVTSIPGSIVDATFLDTTEQTEYAQMFGIRVFGNSLGNAIGSFCGGWMLNLAATSWMLISSAAVLAGAYVYLTLLIRRLRRMQARRAAQDSIA